MWEKLTATLVGFSSHLLGGLKLAASFIGARILAAMGLTFVSYNYVLPDVKSFVGQYLTALPTTARELAGAMGVDVFMVMILSALAARVGMRAFLVGVNQLQQMIGNAGN